MAKKLRKFTLSHNAKKGRWDLTKNKTGKRKISFATKTEAIRTGVLQEVLGKKGGIVTIHKLDGAVQDERTYPRAVDLAEAPG